MTRAGSRLDFVDTLRGYAVIAMILWHTTDSWIREELRSGAIWETLRVLGGLAAPSFLFLAGASLALKARSDARRSVPRGASVRSSVARGLEVLVFGYALRFQMWVIDALGFRAPGAWRVIVPFLAAYALLLVGVNELGPRPRRAVPWLAGGVLSFAVGLAQARAVIPTAWTGLLRVDVLQAIGVSLVVVALAGSALDVFVRRPWLAALLGLSVAVATDAIAARMPGPLPLPLAGYLAKITPPPGARAPSLFPLFPWMSYTFLGAAVGAIWDRGARVGRTTDTVVWLVVAGAIVALLTKEMAPWNDDLLVAAPWLLPASRVLYRVGLVMVLAAIAHALTPSGERAFTPVRWLGQASLLVYWVHLEPSFGIMAVPFRRSLGLGAWAVGFAVLTALMSALAWARLVPLQRWWKRATSRAK